MSGRGNKFSKIKYEERVRDEINLALRREFTDPRLMQVTITHVELTQDYSHAKVYWDSYSTQTRGDSKAAIESTAKRMRKILSDKLKVRHTPELHFVYNSQFEDTYKIEKLLRESATVKDDLMADSLVQEKEASEEINIESVAGSTSKGDFKDHS